ncbi:carboxypeptidase-like regulatory domain-containing protein [Pedobacter punctiformis]|uniref:Carboxypeptidase-like regulatory domain-containing protein n=1 Tax=Pedobacter punctiformis TaxID=3004097 RepID=A0ABT4L3W4_9SPHI|nr:carboxypeptidase-like regulatory domain-containing protein [Pedobacter sp. HCMS5-2]MCZ4242602.1 carboxypeptidase-like regulatory domain-containing protein [Pedobacter sp. HCMS5-2]
MYRLTLFLFLALPLGVFAQTVTTGTIFDYSNKKLSLPGVTVKNLTNKKSTSTNNAGKYTISANVGDLIEFSLVGYHTDTLYLTNLLNRTIYLPVKSNKLNDVNIEAVRLNKSLVNIKDPLAEKYSLLSTGGNLERKKMTDKVGGLGLNLGYGKYKRQQRKEADLEERERYLEEIDDNFNEKTVSEMTKLEGQDLKNFILIYRPSVEAVKAERPYRYAYYISRAYVAWQKLTPEERKLQDLPKLKAN